MWEVVAVILGPINPTVNKQRLDSLLREGWEPYSVSVITSGTGFTHIHWLRRKVSK